MLRLVLLYLVIWLDIVTVIFALPRMMLGDPIQQRMGPANALFVSDPSALAPSRLSSVHNCRKG